MNKEEQPKIMSVDSLIALCHILDDYKEFDKNIQTTITDKNYIKVTNDLCRTYQNPYKVGGKTARELYKKNKHIIDTINEYSNISSFLYYNDNWHKNAYSKTNTKYDLDYFYNYIMNNKTKLGQIRSVLTRIKKLGVQNLEFNKNLDFRENTYEINNIFTDNDKIYYLDNIVILPNYDNSKVKFKTMDSPYEIATQPDGYYWSGTKEEISKYHIDIKLNDLTFDKDRLPKKLNKNIVFDNLLYLKRRINDACNSVKNCIDLSIDIEKLKDMYNNVVKDLINTEDLDHKENVHQILMQVSEGINLLEAVSNNYKEKIVKNNDNILEENIEKEKQNEKVLRKKIITGIFDK